MPQSPEITQHGIGNRRRVGLKKIPADLANDFQLLFVVGNMLGIQVYGIRLVPGAHEVAELVEDPNGVALKIFVEEYQGLGLKIVFNGLYFREKVEVFRFPEPLILADIHKLGEAATEAVFNKAAVLRSNPGVVAAQEYDDPGIRKMLRKVATLFLELLVELPGNEEFAFRGSMDECYAFLVFRSMDVVDAAESRKEAVLQVGGARLAESHMEIDDFFLWHAEA